MTADVLPPDEQLAAEIRAGSSAAFGELFERHGDAVYSYCFRRTASWDLAQDFTSVVFLEAWRGHQRLHVHHGSALPWLYGIATNVCRNARRSSYRARRALSRLPQEHRSDDHADEVAGRVDDQRRMREVLDVIATLPAAQRDVVSLVVWEGLDYAAAAAALDVPVGTVRSRLARARSRLTDAFATTSIQEQR
ncbi:MAG: RNA polymerase sigma factor [Nocardioidaceae bacterium]